MMKFVALALSLFLVSTPSLAKRTPVQRALDGQRASTQRTLTATKSVLAHALPRAQRRLLAINELDDDQNDNPAGPDELDLHSLYARPRLPNREHKVVHDNESVGDYAMVRLAVARARAMEIYRQKFTETS